MYTRIHNMATISSIPASLVAYFGSLVALGTIVLCYILAVSFKHVPAWLPMISNCAVAPPERYPFRVGIVLSAAAFMVLAVLVYNAERAFTKSKVALLFGVLASICLMVVGVVNVKEWPPVHNGTVCSIIHNSDYSVFKLVFPPTVLACGIFLFFDVYMILITWLSRRNKRQALASEIIKILCFIFCSVGLVVAAILSGMPGQNTILLSL